MNFAIFVILSCLLKYLYGSHIFYLKQYPGSRGLALANIADIIILLSLEIVNRKTESPDVLFTRTL